MRGTAALVERLNRFPQGAPPSELLYRILALLFSASEAGLVALLPIKPFTPATAAARPGSSPRRRRARARPARRARVLLDVEDGDGRAALRAAAADGRLLRVLDDAGARRRRPEAARRAVLPVPERRGGLHHATSSPAARRSSAGSSCTSRRCPPDAALARARLRAGQRGRSGRRRTIGVGICYCRHKMEHLGRACDAPMDICMTFNGAGRVARHATATRAPGRRGRGASTCCSRRRTAASSSSARTCAQGVDFICNCCGCCCEAMIAARRFGFLHPVHTTELPAGSRRRQRAPAAASASTACPVEALRLVSANDPAPPGAQAGAARRGALPRLRRLRRAPARQGALAPGAARRARHHAGQLDPPRRR